MKRALPLLLLLFASACATVTTQEVPAAATAELAPTGKLRAALLAANPNFVRQDTPPGVTRGIAVEIAERLAKRLQVPMVPVLYPSVAELVASAGGTNGTSPSSSSTRARRVANFTAPYMYIESTFMVRRGRPRRDSPTSIAPARRSRGCPRHVRSGCAPMRSRQR